jgi:Leucine-rich repeat (LRR) protein
METALDDSLFSDLSDLRWLVLSNNRLSSVRPGTFKPMVNLQMLSLVNNNFVKPIDGSEFEGLDQLTSIRV